MESTMNFKKGKKKREELQLPILTFVATDDWIDKLGNDAFVAWLKFYSWCDRSDERVNKEMDVVPRSFSKVMKELGMGSKKFYNSVIRPLWNYGLIDIEEYTESQQEGTKPNNIIVYEYPQNNITKRYKPLEKIRDYDIDYTSTARVKSIEGVKSKREKLKQQLEKKSNEGSEGVSSRNRGVFPHETGGCFTEKHNNDSNGINNDSNSINNDSNLYLNLTDTIWYLDIPMTLKQKIKIKVKENQLPITNNQLLEIEHAYHYQVEKGLVVPEANYEDDGLNDIEFANMISELLNQVDCKEIKSMKAIIDKWTYNAFSYKFDRIRKLIN